MGGKLFWQAYLNAPDRTGTHEALSLVICAVPSLYTWGDLLMLLSVFLFATMLLC